MVNRSLNCSGHLTEVKQQPLKALSPMLVTFSGMVMEVRLLQPEKANLPMLVTFFPIVTDFNVFEFSKGR